MEPARDVLNELLSEVKTMKQGIEDLGHKVGRLETKVGQLDEDLGRKVRQLDEDLGRKVGRLENTVAAFESMPQPYGRPKTFMAATAFHSVSKAVRTKS